MIYNQLGDSDLKVSQICLGTMTYGEQNTIEEAHEQLDFALERGVNFIDTAEMYPVPPKKETFSLTEQYIGKWDKIKTHRDKIILATKVIGPMGETPHIRDGKPKLNRKHIIQAVDDSLKRLGTDYIDLYQLHWPERKTNFFGRLSYKHKEDSYTPFLERLEAFAELKKAGKVRHFGVSNETPWGVMTYLKLSEMHNLPKIVSVQNPYSLLNRSYEVGLAEVSHREKVSLLAYSPLGMGVLSGKYLNGNRPEGARLTIFDVYKRYTNPEAIKATEAYVELAKSHNLSPTQLALAFVNQQGFCDSNIIGATKISQLKENIESIEVTLKSDVLEEIEKIHKQFTIPAP